ncbi:MAG: PKD domain-containing protein [Saprospiraceae bacterium]
MQNGEGLNPSPISSSFADDGLPLSQGVLALPYPDHEGQYFLLHEDMDYPTATGVGVHSKRFYYSSIDMNSNAGLGIVMDKNVIIVEDTLDIGKITATNHGNGRDWWVLVREYGTNRYYKIFIDPEGVHNYGILSVGMPTPSPSLGQAVFSSDGSKYVNLNIYDFEQGNFINIYDFDRCKGLLENDLQINYTDSVWSGGVAVSPNSRFLYVSSYEFIYQYDLWSSDIADSKVVVAEYDGYLEEITPSFYLPTRFHLMQLAPDGKIYITTSNGVKSLHVINSPNLAGKACNVEQHAIKLMTYNARSMPNFPNYRLGPLPIQPSMEYSESGDTVYFTGSADGGEVFEWDFGDGEVVQSGNTISHVYAQPGTYVVTLTVEAYCISASVSDTVVVSFTGNAEANKPPQIILQPNPTQGHLGVQLNLDGAAGNCSFLLYDATARPALRQRLLTGWNSLDLSQVPTGLYFYEIKEEGRLLGSGKLVRVE